jgi:hypothetical protein
VKRYASTKHLSKTQDPKKNTKTTGTSIGPGKKI